MYLNIIVHFLKQTSIVSTFHYNFFHKKKNADKNLHLKRTDFEAFLFIPIAPPYHSRQNAVLAFAARCQPLPKIEPTLDGP